MRGIQATESRNETLHDTFNKMKLFPVCGNESKLTKYYFIQRS